MGHGKGPRGTKRTIEDNAKGPVRHDMANEDIEEDDEEDDEYMNMLQKQSSCDDPCMDPPKEQGTEGGESHSQVSASRVLYSREPAAGRAASSSASGSYAPHSGSVVLRDTPYGKVLRRNDHGRGTRTGGTYPQGFPQGRIWADQEDDPSDGADTIRSTSIIQKLDPGVCTKAGGDMAGQGQATQQGTSTRSACG